MTRRQPGESPIPRHRLSVYGTSISGRNPATGRWSHDLRAIVAATSGAAARRAIGVGDSFWRVSGAETRNGIEVAQAMTAPGTVFVHARGTLDWWTLDQVRAST